MVGKTHKNFKSCSKPFTRLPCPWGSLHSPPCLNFALIHVLGDLDEAQLGPREEHDNRQSGHIQKQAVLQKAPVAKQEITRTKNLGAETNNLNTTAQIL